MSCAWRLLPSHCTRAKRATVASPQAVVVRFLSRPRKKRPRTKPIGLVSQESRSVHPASNGPSEFIKWAIRERRCNAMVRNDLRQPAAWNGPLHGIHMAALNSQFQGVPSYEGREWCQFIFSGPWKIERTPVFHTGFPSACSRRKRGERLNESERHDRAFAANPQAVRRLSLLGRSHRRMPRILIDRQ